MIHSMSGGVIRERGVHTFVKVEIGGAPVWYLSPFPVKEGDIVLAPYGAAGTPARGRVLKVETCDEQTAPYPMNRIREIECVL